MAPPRNPIRTRARPERTCTCSKCEKRCNSTPGKKHRRCGGVWE